MESEKIYIKFAANYSRIKNLKVFLILNEKYILRIVKDYVTILLIIYKLIMLFKPLVCIGKAFSNTLLFTFLMLSFSAFTAVSCKKDKDYSRDEYILVADALDTEKQTQARILLPLEGASENEPKVLYVWANVDYEISFETDDETEDWVKIVDRRHNAALGVDEIVLSVAPMKESYMQRSGTLSLRKSDIYLNHFVRLVQGYPSRIGSDFDWLQYGSDNPLDGMEGKLISKWTQSEKDRGWTSTPSNDGVAYCYGRDGFIQLGDAEGHGADLITPYNVNLRRDTVIMAAFNAVAYKSITETDLAELKVEVTGGGQFLDGTTSKTVTVAHIDPSAQDVAADMWNDTYHGYTIIGTKDNPLTGDTHIRLSAGSLEKPTSNTRIFIDNFNVLTINREWWDLLFDEYPWEKTE